jgi:hydrogenase/urease accessory protein HupE
MELIYVWGQATTEAKIIIVFLIGFSIAAWSVMAAKALQMRRAKKLNAILTRNFAASPM